MKHSKHRSGVQEQWKKKRFGGSGDNKQEEEVWEVSPSSKPEGGPEKGRKQGEKSKK